MPVSWLATAAQQSVKPQQSVIGVLRKNLGGYQEGRSIDEVHASDITKMHFCPRKWAFMDLQAKKAEPEFLPAALDVTFQMGVETERKIVEEWGGDAVIGNWKCRRCDDQRTMTKKPVGFCKDGKKHWWEYIQIVIETPEYGIVGSLDALFDVGLPLWLITELKTMAPTEFEKIVVPLPEHRIRTNLYMKLVEESNHPWKTAFNVSEARVLYVSRAHGKLNAEWNEILPFKEYVVKREDTILKPMLMKAMQVKIWRTENKMPSGICSTALDKMAKTCKQCQVCFSGQFVSQQEILL